jgi:hypothetical protein
MFVRVTCLFFKNPLCPRVRPCVCVCIHEDVLIPIPPGGFSFTADGALVDAWPYFPGLKVGHLYLYSSFFGYLVVLIIRIRNFST